MGEMADLGGRDIISEGRCYDICVFLAGIVKSLPESFRFLPFPRIDVYKALLTEYRQGSCWSTNDAISAR